MATTIASPAPAAASTPAPAAAPAAAPVSAPVSTPAATPAPAARQVGNSGVTSAVDPGQFSSKGAYAEALLAEQLAANPEVAENPVIADDVAEQPAAEPGAETVEVPAPDAPAPEAPEEKPEEAAEPEFRLDEPESIVTPEGLTKMITDTPEFGALLEANPALKGQLYKTAREAAELKPYRELYPDIESAREAAQAASTFADMQGIFMDSTTLEGTQKTLAKMMELSYERDDQGNVLMENGQPKVGDDFYGFMDNVVKLDIQDRLETAKQQHAANQYHMDPRVQALAQKGDLEAAQALADSLYAQGEQKLKFLGDMIAEEAPQEVPEPIRKQKEALDARERAIAEKERGEKIQSRKEFDASIADEAKKRASDAIEKIIASVEKQGGVISPFLRGNLPQIIGGKLIDKIRANPELQRQTAALVRLPVGDAARQRRLASVDRIVQQYLPEIARAELRDAGVQIATAAQAKQGKVDQQALNTRQTEPKGTTGPAGLNNKPMEAKDAFAFAQKEWEQQNPGRRFDSVARSRILQRVVDLQLR